jgi:hypothetical protein
MSNTDPNIYIVCDYYATGEGTTVLTLITRATPHKDDYSEDYSTVKNTSLDRAFREFEELFGPWYTRGAEVLDRYEFFHRYGHMVPSILYKMCDPEDENFPPGFNWHSSLHFNYS